MASKAECCRTCCKLGNIGNRVLTSMVKKNRQTFRNFLDFSDHQHDKELRKMASNAKIRQTCDCSQFLQPAFNCQPCDILRFFAACKPKNKWMCHQIQCLNNFGFGWIIYQIDQNPLWKRVPWAAGLLTCLFDCFLTKLVLKSTSMRQLSGGLQFLAIVI